MEPAHGAISTSDSSRSYKMILVFKAPGNSRQEEFVTVTNNVLENESRRTWGKDRRVNKYHLSACFWVTVSEFIWLHPARAPFGGKRALRNKSGRQKPSTYLTFVFKSGWNEERIIIKVANHFLQVNRPQTKDLTPEKMLRQKQQQHFANVDQQKHNVRN